MKRNILLVIGAIVALMLVFNSTKRLLSFRTTSQKVNEAQMQLDKLKQENSDLQKQLAYTQTQQFQEEQIRDKLGLAKPGETVVMLPNQNNNSQPTDSASQAVPEPNYIKWWNIFFGS